MKVQEAQAVLLKDRQACGHLRAGPKDMRCPECGGIMRRCCQSIISWPHVRVEHA